MSPRAIARVAGGLAAAFVVAAVGPRILRATRTHRYFAVREVAVRGTHRLAPDEVRRIAGVEPGVSVWDVDDARAEARLREEPWVRSAEVRRHVPHRVTIRIREERPAAILATEGGPRPALYYVATSGRVVAPVRDGDGLDFPYVTGLRDDDVRGAEAFGPQAIRQALRLARLAAHRGPVSEIHVDRTRGLTLLPVAPAVPVDVGWGRFADKLHRLPAVLALWSGRETELAGISLLFKDEVIVRTRAVVKPAGKPAARA